MGQERPSHREWVVDGQEADNLKESASCEDVDWQNFHRSSLVRMTGGTTLDWLRNHGPGTLLGVCFPRKSVKFTLMVLASSSKPSFLSVRNSWTSLRWSPWSWITSPISVSTTMVPLQAIILLDLCADTAKATAVLAAWAAPTKFLLDDLKDFLLIEFLGKTLNCS